MIEEQKRIVQIGAVRPERTAQQNACPFDDVLWFNDGLDRTRLTQPRLTETLAEIIVTPRK
jgi:hypothetical protein